MAVVASPGGILVFKDRENFAEKQMFYGININ